MARVALIGLGNVLLKDEGIGVHVANAIKERFTFTPEVDVIDGGTLGLDLLQFFEDKDRVIVVDAVDFRKEPGHIGVIEDDAIPSTLFAKLSVHHIGLSDILFALKLLERTPSRLTLIGVQPESLEVGLDMTPSVSTKVENVIELIIKTLKEWNIACASRSPQELSA